MEPFGSALGGSDEDESLFGVGRESEGSHDHHLDEPLRANSPSGDSQGGWPPGAALPRTHNGRCSVQDMPGFNQAYLSGEHVPNPPSVRPHIMSKAGWVRFDEAGLFDIVPVRMMCMQIPVGCFQFGATRFPHWESNRQNPARCSAIAALVGMMWTGTSKGFLSGNHAELQRFAESEPQDEEEGPRKRKPPQRVNTYTYIDPNDGTRDCPMFTLAYEELPDREDKEVLFIRIWKLVFDPRHSESELWRRLMDENVMTWQHSGVAHAPNAQRSMRQVPPPPPPRPLLPPSTVFEPTVTFAGAGGRAQADASTRRGLESGGHAA